MHVRSLTNIAFANRGVTDVDVGSQPEPYKPLLKSLRIRPTGPSQSPGIPFRSHLPTDYGLYEHVRSAHLTGAAQEWVYDREALEKELGDGSEEVVFAVAEIVDQFWASDLEDGRSHRQRLIDSGAKIS